jgi:hypothetical protein
MEKKKKQPAIALKELGIASGFLWSNSLELATL